VKLLRRTAGGDSPPKETQEQTQEVPKFGRVRTIGLTETRARGRNGWFRAATAHIEHYRTDVWLSISSGRPAQIPPIMLRLSLPDHRLLVDALTRTHQSAASSSAEKGELPM
jgi:hypothetical protein